MPSQSATQAVWSVTLPTPEDTVRFAARIADFLRAGDLVTLSGDLGVGKTAFARALVRHIAQDAELEVPSPTFTLMQLYDTPSFPIVHADLYRIRSATELAELGWDEASDGALLLVEWAERIGDALPEDRLDVTLSIDPANPRPPAPPTSRALASSPRESPRPRRWRLCCSRPASATPSAPSSPATPRRAPTSD